MKKIWNLIKDEIVLITGLTLSWLFVKLTIQVEENLFWVSLLITTISGFYFSSQFFKKRASIESFLSFLAMLVATILYFAFTYIVFGLNGLPEEQGIHPNLVQALYFSFVTWTTLGYGDLTPTEASMPWMVLEVMLGYIFMALLVGKVLAFSELLRKESKSAE